MCKLRISDFCFVILDNNLDWEYLRSLTAYETIYDVLKSTPNGEVKKIEGTMVKLAFENRLMRIREVCFHMSPASAFPDSKSSNYAEYFGSKYGAVTNDMKQCLIETEHLLSPGFNYLLRSAKVLSSASSAKRVKTSLKKIHFIAEHLKLIPFDESELNVLFMIPNIFHRLNSILKASKFQRLMEKELKNKLKITNKV